MSVDLDDDQHALAQRARGAPDPAAAPRPARTPPRRAAPRTRAGRRGPPGSGRSAGWSSTSRTASSGSANSCSPADMRSTSMEPTRARRRAFSSAEATVDSELLGAEGLGQEGLGAHAQARLRAGLLRGDDDDGDVGRPRLVRLHLLQHLVPVHLRHRQVEQHGGGLQPLQLLQRLAAIARGVQRVVARRGWRCSSARMASLSSTRRRDGRLTARRAAGTGGPSRSGPRGIRASG